MPTYCIKRNGKLYGPFSREAVAKCINTDIFTAKDEISENQINWMTIEDFQIEQKLIKEAEPVFQAASAYNSVNGGAYVANGSYSSAGYSQPGVYPAQGVYPSNGGFSANAQGYASNAQGAYVNNAQNYAYNNGNCPPPPPSQGYPQATAVSLPPYGSGKPKYYGDYWLWACFLGSFGAHDFFANYTVRGIIKLALTLFGLSFISGIWALVDMFIVKNDAQGNLLQPGGCRRVAYILLCVLYGITGLHHLYAGFVMKWIIHLAACFLLFVPCVAGYVIAVASGVEAAMFILIAFAVGLLAAYIIILIKACMTKTDADGYDFI